MRSLFLLPVFLAAFASVFCAEPCCPTPEPSRPLIGSNARGAKVRPERQPDCCITPDGAPWVACGIGVQLSASFIYWTAREDHLAFAYREDCKEHDHHEKLHCDSHTFSPDSHFEPGFKVGLGYLLCHDGWDLYGEYTFLRVDGTRKSVSIDDLDSQAIVPIGRSEFAELVDVFDASGVWDLDFNLIDLEMGRRFYLSPCLLIRPHFGLKTTWQDQRFEIRSLGFFEDDASQGLSHNKMDIWGVGIRGGLDTTWRIRCGWSFFGELALTALWEQFDVTKRITRAPAEFEAGENPINLLYVGNCFHSIKPVFEIQLGFSWETWFCCDQYHFALLGGWEMQWWGGQNQFFRKDLESRWGDLTLQGLTLKARFDF